MYFLQCFNAQSGGHVKKFLKNFEQKWIFSEYDRVKKNDA